MALVFSPDLLFVHVNKTGGTSVALHLIEVLPRPVYYVNQTAYRIDHRPGVTHVPGHPHQRLADAAAFIEPFGLRLPALPLVLAVVRNPYDLFVSHYSWQKLRTTTVALLDGVVAPAPPADSVAADDVAAALAALEPDRAVRVDLDEHERLEEVRDALHRAAIAAGQRVVTWNEGSTLFALPAPATAKPKPHRVRDRAHNLDFREFVFWANTDRRATFLGGLYDFYHLDGAMPPNLRILRFERLGDDLRDVLREAGLPADRDLPWVNRSERRAWATLYDAETEAVVYEQARWMFERGLYERLRLEPLR